MKRGTFRPDIQGLRALAVLAVLGYHAGVPGFGGGYLGVDVFFVISGYLIGGQLVQSIAATGRIDLWTFYARRARRILPASLTVIALTTVASVALLAPLRSIEVVTDAVWAALSGANLRFAVVGTDYLAGTTPSPLQHYWSLGVEEQFYIVTPLLLIALFALLGRHPRLLLAAGAVVIAASFAICLAGGVDSPWTYFGLPARAWELGLGVLAAVAAGRWDVARTPARILSVAGVVGLAVAAVAGSVEGFPHPGAGTLIPVAATALLLVGGSSAGSGEPTLVARALGIRPAVFVGTLSFSLYLVHWPLLALPRELAGQDLPWPATLGLVAFAFPAAWLLWRFVETPFLSGRPSRLTPRRSVAAGAVATAAVVASLVLATPALAAAPLHSDRTAVDALAPFPSGTPYVPENVHPALLDAIDDTGELYTDGCQQNKTEAELLVCSFGPANGAVVVLFGDSHAGRWFPAMREAFRDEPVRLVTLTKSGCRSIETEQTWAGAQNASCAAWRASALDWIAQNHPDLVVLGDHIGLGDPAELETRWRDATESTLARFPHAQKVAIFAETPEFAQDVPVCLSRNLDDAGRCGEDRSQAVNQAVITGVRAGAAQSGATFVDLTDWFCSATRCPAVIGRTVVYTDTHHVSATFSSQLGPAVRAALEPLLAG